MEGASSICGNDVYLLLIKYLKRFMIIQILVGWCTLTILEICSLYYEYLSASIINHEKNRGANARMPECTGMPECER